MKKNKKKILKRDKKQEWKNLCKEMGIEYMEETKPKNVFDVNKETINLTINNSKLLIVLTELLISKKIITKKEITEQHNDVKKVWEMK